MLLRRVANWSVIATALLAVFALPHTSFAISRTDPGFAPLDAIYYIRADLKKIFNEHTWRANDPASAPYPTLVVWAQASGYLEYPDKLGMFAPKSSSSPVAVSHAAVPSEYAPFKSNRDKAPKKISQNTFSPTAVTAKAVYVVDVNSETPLLAIEEDSEYPVASLTKLMTAQVALENGLAMNRTVSMAAADEVGGARINAKTGARFSTTDLFYAMLVGSANNATNAVARSTGIPKTKFISLMNSKAKTMGLSKTTFVDPTGIELGNVSTVKEIAYIALRAYENPYIKRATTTAKYQISTAHAIKNTNGLLLDNSNGLYVLGGKTGYLPEIGWNFVVKMRDNKGNRPLLVAVMGSGDRIRSFDDAETVAHWIWNNYQWK